MLYKPLKAVRAINKVKGRFPYRYDLNIYRGCQHHCAYCFARYSHRYIDDDTHFFDTIYYKTGILEALEKQLSSPSWKREVVNIGGITDSYQPIESKLKIMPDILRLMIKYKTPIIISTKSTLILRDIELIKELSKITYVNIACTITTLEDEIQARLEPGASKSIHRFKVLKIMKEQTNAYVGVHVMPIIPYLTDSDKNLDTIYHIASDIGVDYVLPGTLYLRGQTKPYFLSVIKQLDIDLYDRLSSLYSKPLSKEYKAALYSRINQYKKQYHVTSNYKQFMKDK